MRPSILFPLFAPLETLPSVGPKSATRLKKLVGPRVLDLLSHLPTRLETRHYSVTLTKAPVSKLVTVIVTVGEHWPPRAVQRPYRVKCYDETRILTLVFFHARGAFLEQQLPIGEKRLVSGLLEIGSEGLQMIHPDHIGLPAEVTDWQGTRGLYSLTAGIHAKNFSKIIKTALERAPVLPEWISPTLKERHQWFSWNEALGAAHTPKKEEDLLPVSSSRQRLAFDELLAHQLSMGLVRLHRRKSAGISIKGTGTLTAEIQKNLPFSLTHNQEEVLKEIFQDMESPTQMVRLLQGDVGSGKTIVAFLAMVTAVEAGYQAVLLAPTEVLAQQHYETFKKFIECPGLQAGLFIGQNTTAQRKELHQKLSDGLLQIAIGTHALLEKNILFKNLGFVVIDEQHRFGVDQRLKLMEKGKTPDVLVMTATPIPRSLSLTAYGELAVSSLKEKPLNRLPIHTSIISLDRIQEVHQALARILKEGQKVYWVCPLIEESEVLDLGHAKIRFETLQKLFGDQVGWAHGRLSAEERDNTLGDFKKGNIKILVSTTIIEVGIDIADATVMIIEHAERFGLSQLHQLRGRVGRGSQPSSCLLLYGKNFSVVAQKRLKILRDSQDGFRIAEEDLKLRGSGELLGTKQSGFPDFQFAVFPEHQDLLYEAYEESRQILTQDPLLLSGQGQALKLLLNLFYPDSVRLYLGAG